MTTRLLVNRTPSFSYGEVQDIYDQAYRVDGVDANGKAIIHKVDIQEYYTIRTDFTATGTSLYYRYTTGAWSLFNIYI